MKPPASPPLSSLRPGGAPEPSDADRHWLRAAIALSRRCPPSSTAFSVGAIVVDATGAVVAEGYSRRDDPHDHAEETALRGIDAADPRLAGATLYSSLEPCTQRTSRTRTCTDLVLATAIPRIVVAWREPAVFVHAQGVERLRGAGRTVVEVGELAAEAREVNTHLLA
ncbi:cytidine/deoxycytidylate deaminase family protein [Streptomonospora litoralis]|uniref:Riboflavin biosynthesis protein RibD n=1 Tax=Streptomonospora litoralis TaxID=2498135 RepID=A0A4V0ZJG4_9ACTN|nr:dCMP deaminase [Streptomonospora litoralis]QBI53392.1 Riboflavin biosynthesis protein RibD [Streptomonospora litoralis]